MSLVFGTREVSVGPTVGFHGDVHSQSTKTTSIVDHVNELSNNLKSSSSNSFINGGELKDQDYKTKISCFSVDPDLGSYSDSSSIDDVESSRSSTDDDEVGEEDETEIQSKFKSSLCSLESLEDSLPIKRGLSNFFTGKSKSFANLSEATTVRSLGKIENPFNKRRRTLIACKRRRRSRTFYTSSVNPVSMPLLTLNEEQSDQDDEEQSDVDHESGNNIKEEEEDNVYLSKKHESRKIKSYKPTRCFSLTDFHHHNHHL